MTGKGFSELKIRARNNAFFFIHGQRAQPGFGVFDDRKIITLKALSRSLSNIAQSAGEHVLPKPVRDPPGLAIIKHLAVSECADKILGNDPFRRRIPMGTQSSKGQGPFDFIDRLIGLFHHSDPEATPPAPGQGAPLTKQFETSLVALEKTIEQQRREQASETNFGWQRSLKVEDEELKKSKEQKIYAQIRQDIESAHQRLKTGISPHEVDLLKEYLGNASETFTSGEKSHDVLLRCRASILKRIHYEAGCLALNQMDDYLAKRNEAWPTRPPRNPAISAEEIHEIAKRNLTTTRKIFINNSIHHSSLLIVGIVEVWKSDYPEADSALWKSVVLEAVATALRARLMHLFTTRLRHDREFIENKTTELIGAKVAELNQTLQGGLTSINDAHRVVASSLKILDEVIPNLAWEHVQKVVPEAKWQQGCLREAAEQS